MFGFSLNEDRDVGVGVFPESEGIVVGRAQIANREASNNSASRDRTPARPTSAWLTAVLSWFACFLHLGAPARVAARPERLFHLRPQQVQDDYDV